MRILGCLLAISCISNSSQLVAFAESQEEEHRVVSTDSEKKVLDSSKQLLVRVQLAEVSLSKIRKLGVDFSFLRENEVIKNSGNEAFMFGDGFIYSTGHFGALLSALVQNKIARILADPSVVTVDGKAASLSAGGTVRIANQEGGKKSDQSAFVRIGTDLRILPTFLPDDRVSIDLKLDWSELCDDKKPSGSKRHYEFDTSLEVPMGSSVLMSGLSQRANVSDEEETMLLLVVSVNDVEKTAAAKQSQVE